MPDDRRYLRLGIYCIAFAVGVDVIGGCTQDLSQTIRIRKLEAELEAISVEREREAGDEGVR